MDKIKIEKNTVQETLIIPLIGRKICSEKFPDLYYDPYANELCDRLDYDFSEVERKRHSFLYEFASLEAAMRQLDICFEIREYLGKHPKATIVNLGCGLDETGKVCDNGTCHIVNVDFPDVMAVRQHIIPPSDRETNIACDLKDYSWMERINGQDGVILFAAGVFYYFQKEEVKQMVGELSKKFPKGCLVFDSVGEFGLKLLMKKVLKDMDMSKVKGFFYSNNPPSDLNWYPNIQVTTKAYMLGYYDMKSSGVSFLHRFLARICDRNFKMAINRMDFQ